LPAGAKKSSVSPTVIVFPRKMVTPASIPPAPAPAPEAKPSGFWQKHGTTAAWVAILFSFATFAISVATLLTTWHFHDADSSARSFDEHTNALIDNKLNPAVEKINGNVDTKLGLLNGRLQDLSRDLARIQGRLGIYVSGQRKLKSRLDQQTSLAKLIDPNRILGTIRAEIQLAQDTKNTLSISDLNDYKNVVQALPASAREYWTTVAAIINYQSLLNQMSGSAPDPAAISHVCSGLTSGTGGYNVIEGGEIRNCILDLDSTHNLLRNVVVSDSVVRYHGGQVAIQNVWFKNCRFILELSGSAQPPAHPEFLLALLDSNQQLVTLSTHPKENSKE
jgi:hypothetical protein